MLNSDARWEIEERPKTYVGYRDIILPPEIMEKVKKAADECKIGFPVIPYTPDGLYKKFRKSILCYCSKV